MKNSQKGFVVPLLVAIIALLVVGGGVYVYENGKVEVPVVIDNTKQQQNKIHDVNVVSNNSTNSPVKSVSAPAPVDVPCPGGVPCPNPGAITVSLSQNTWNVGGPYRVLWTNSLPSSSYSFYYVEIGVGTSSPRFPNGSDLGFWTVDGSKNYLDVDFTAKLAEMRVLNSYARNYDSVKNVFFVRVLAINDNGTAMWQDDKTVAAGNSPLFSVRGYTGYSYPLSPVAIPPGVATPTTVQARATGRNAQIKADIMQLRIMAELAQANTKTFATFCQNGLVDISQYKDLPALVQDIVTTQGVSDQAHAGLTCVSGPGKYAFGIVFTNQTAVPGVTSYCLDSTGYGGDNSKYVLNPSTISCKVTQ